MNKFNWWMRASALFLLWAMVAITLPAQTVSTGHSFDVTVGAAPTGGLVQAANGSLYGATENGAVDECGHGAFCGTAFDIIRGGDRTNPHQYRFVLHNFSGYPMDGSGPGAAMVQGADGSLYGTTTYGGMYSNTQCRAITGELDTGCGTVYKITPSGEKTSLHSFCKQSTCPDGFIPSAAVVQGANGDFYGTTVVGGNSNKQCMDGTAGPFACGTVYRINSSGTSFTTLYSFCSQDGCADGAVPRAGLTQATDGNFYGITMDGGANGDGTVFKITPSGTLTTLHSFDGTDGAYPYAGLVQGADGNFYGTTEAGGANNFGTVFTITPGGMLTSLHSFAGYPADGAQPYAALVQGTDGNFYGTTQYGGSNINITCQPTVGCGTVFNITPGGTLTTIYNFCSLTNCQDGAQPYAGLIQATDGNFYGTTGGGGAEDCNGGFCGTVFQMPPSGGTVKTLLIFHGTNGQDPAGAVVQDTNGTLYGTTFYGGPDNYGVVFRLPVGLGPFLETQPTSGPVGGTVKKILGTNLTGSTSVTFNGAAATFTVVSSSEITTTVPAGATTGTVQVVTPTATLSSNVPFRVQP